MTLPSVNVRVVSLLLAAAVTGCDSMEGAGGADLSMAGPKDGMLSVDLAVDMAMAQPPDLAGTTCTSMIGAEGGALTCQGVTVTVPAGALARTETISVGIEGLTAPAGFTGYSPVFKFEPAGLTFASPVTVSIPFTGDAKLATLFWSRPTGGGHYRLGGLAGGGVVSGQVNHFSTGFVADGVTYAEPPDLTCTVARLIEGRTMSPSLVALFLTADDCAGRPLVGLKEADFVAREDGTAVSVADGKALLAQDGLQVFVNLLIDMSQPAESARAQAIAAAQAFVSQAQAKSRKLQIGVTVFAGDATALVWVEPTLDTAKLIAQLDALSQNNPLNELATRNLYGALIQSMTDLQSWQSAFKSLNYGGAFTTGFHVLFTAGGDTAKLSTLQDVLAAQGNSPDQLITVAVRGVAFDKIAEDAVNQVACAELPSAQSCPNTFVAPDATTLHRDFSAAAQRVASQVARTYLLGYCSPARSGTPGVAVSVAGSANSQPAMWSFSAAGFLPGCDANVIAGRCAGKQCGGLGCGACDDRLAGCDEGTSQCVDYCVLAGACGGELIVNPRDYEQVCQDGPQATECNGSCIDTTLDPDHCGGCAMACMAGGVCEQAACKCPGATEMDCGGTCRDLASDAANCGACNMPCAVGVVCTNGKCSSDFEWAPWPMPNPVGVGLPNPPMYDTSTAGVVVDKVTGLTWQREVDWDTYTLADAASYCANLALAGGGWRLPSAIELVSIVDFTRTGPAIDVVTFPDTPATFFWTSSPLAGFPAQAWYVNFNLGNSYLRDVVIESRVRCVR